MKRLHSTIPLLALLLCTSPTLAQTPKPTNAIERSPQAKVTLEGPSRFIKNFPAILKLKCTGPQPIPQATIFSGNQNVSLDLVSKKDGPTDSIHSKAFSLVELMGSFGGSMGGMTGRMDRMDVPMITLPAGEQRTMLLDLSTLFHSESTGFGAKKSLNLANVPDGKYTLTVTFADFMHPISPSNPPVAQCNIELKSPSPKQQQFLDKAKERFIKLNSRVPSVYPEGRYPTWAEFLTEPVPLTDLISDLDAPAHHIMSYHLLLNEFIMYPARLEELDEALFKHLEAIPVPKYLKLDKKCLLLEIRLFNYKFDKDSRDAQKQMDAIVRQDKGLAWRIEIAKNQRFPDFFESKNHYRRIGR